MEEDCPRVVHFKKTLHLIEKKFYLNEIQIKILRHVNMKRPKWGGGGTQKNRFMVTA